MTDRKRQEEEIIVLQSIYTPEELDSCNSGDKIVCTFKIKPIIDDKVTILLDEKRLRLSHLPPLTLCTTNPRNYPSKKPPHYDLVIPWLGPESTLKIRRHLNELWLRNKTEILFTWTEFLKNVFTHDGENVVTISKLTLEELESYNVKEEMKKFGDSLFQCMICFESKRGYEGDYCKSCKFSSCKDCLRRYLDVKIKDETVKDKLTKGIKCPATDCSALIQLCDIKNIHPVLCDWYDGQLLKAALDSMEDVVYCPRKSCLSPVITDDADENLATCSRCLYNFCKMCKKVYHGVAPCEMPKVKVDQLITDYENATPAEISLLIQKYGRRQIQKLVEDKLTKEHIKKNTKSCPRCKIAIDKQGGCNRMKCPQCQSKFCWLCGAEITANSYGHFIEENNCYGQLFQGMEGAEEYPFEELVFNIERLVYNGFDD